ncbi:MAG: hypothetical protein DRP22_05045 [Verrucomicrobia bacterium]|nr:MAG: hypothetical protein DRP22_05045 [Verrucomicrobiota bacterium]
MRGWLRYQGTGFSEIADDVRMAACAVRSGWPAVRRRAQRLVFTGLLLTAAAVMLDPAVEELVLQRERPETVRHLAREISSKAQPTKMPGLLIMGCWLAGRIASRRRLRLFAMAMLASVVMAGITDNAIRVVVGRPRPYVSAQPWHPFSFEEEFQSFPSAHTAVAFATAVPAVECHPALGGLLMAGAAATGWARIYLRDHYLSDVVAGAYLGAICGVILSAGLRKAGG